MPLPLASIVDDNPEKLTVIGEWLQPDNAVRAADFGARALRLARLQRRRDLSLLDVMLPGMDGCEVLRFANRPSAHRDGRGQDVVGKTFAQLLGPAALDAAELQLQAVNEQRVGARNRAQTAHRAKSAFLANISHQFRTPMNANIGLTHLMPRDVRDAVAEARRARWRTQHTPCST